MKIEHLAIWVQDLESMRSFYEKYFKCNAGEKYTNHSKNFSSYFLTFNSGCRLELMHMPGIPKTKDDPISQFSGLIHFAISTGSKELVNQLTERLRSDGFK
ncbi:MAG: glyoxalase, partial [Saprospiraceae bacterium]|nr:glyoxalase [Saprospiraceae bacterium]